METIQKILNSTTIGNRPVNLTNELLPMIKSNYAVSIKADGVRCFLYYDEFIYSITTNTKLYETKKKGYLLDCEYIEKLDTYYIFDILIHNYKSVVELNLKERRALLDEDLLRDNIKIKEIYNLDNKGNVFTISKSIYKKYEYDVDGIIYTPIYEPYYNNVIYKWKPLHLQTIDFLIREVKGVFQLFVSSNNKNIRNKVLQDKQYTTLFPFITNKNNYFPSYFATANIKVHLVKNKGSFYGNHNNILIKDNTIVEFYYDKEWKPYRFRLDKTEGYLENYSKNIYDVSKGPNSWRTAMSIFQYIQNPIDTDVLFGDKEISNDYYLHIKKKGLPINLYGYNNFIKSYLYNTYLHKNDKVLDLAGGRGGDLLKMKNSNYVLHIDIVNKLLEEAKKRYDGMNKKQEIDFLKFNLLGNNVSKINKIKSDRNIKEFDVITCQFAFHYLCESKKTIDFVINIINNNLKNGGIFMMTGYDGKMVFDLLKDTEVLEYKYKGTFAKIIKKYDGRFKNYGQIINVYIEKIGIPQDEYLINFEYITKQFKKHNIKVVEESYFNKSYKYLSEDELKYIGLHKYIVYKKD